MLDESQFYTDPVYGTKYTSYASYQQNTQGVTLPTTANPETGQAISLDQLGPVAPITVPQPNPSSNPLESAAAGATATSKSLDQYIKELTPPESDTSKQYNNLTADLSTLLPGLGGRGEAQVQAETNAGLPAQKKQLADLNAQILAGVAEANKVKAEYDKLYNESSNRQVSLAQITSQQAQIRRQQLVESNSKAADLGLLQARALGLQGNIQAAQDSVNRAIDLKYADREDQVNLKLEQLKLLEGKLNKEQETTKLALEHKYKDEQDKIAEEKAKSKENVSLAFSANVQTPFVNKNGEFFDARTGQVMKDPAAFFKAAGVTSFDQAYARGLVTDLTPQKVADVEFTQQARLKYPDAGINISDSMETIKNKLLNSTAFRLDQSQIAANLAKANVDNSSLQQDKLEQQYRTILVKELSNRSGGLGLQDAKVNQAIHLKALLDQYKDSSGNYNVPSSQYAELAMGLAALVSGTNAVSDSAREAITQRTLKGDLAGAIGYITGEPQSASTQGFYKNLADSIDRQGKVAQDIRDQDVKFLHGLAPTGLNQSRIDALEKESLSSYDSGNSGGTGVIEYQGQQYKVDSQGNLIPLTNEGSGSNNANKDKRAFTPLNTIPEIPKLNHVYVPLGPLATSNPSPYGVIGGYDITNYATDPNHEKAVFTTYQGLQKGKISTAASIDNYIQSKAKGSPVKARDVLDAANTYAVDPKLIVALIQQDSTFGTKGVAVRTKNPGNVGNTGSGTQGFKSWRDGIFAVAQNLSKRRIKA